MVEGDDVGLGTVRPGSNGTPAEIGQCVGVVSVTPVPGVSAYTATVFPDATATMRSRAVLLRFRLIAAARLVALVATVLDTWNLVLCSWWSRVKVRVTAVPPVGVMVTDVVFPPPVRR